MSEINIGASTSASSRSIDTVRRNNPNPTFPVNDPIPSLSSGSTHSEPLCIERLVGRISHPSNGPASGIKELLERALTIQENHYGKDHFQLAITLVTQ